MKRERGREPSTWAGLGALAALLLPELGPDAPELLQHVATAAGAVAAALAIVLRERGA